MTGQLVSHPAPTAPAQPVRRDGRARLVGGVRLVAQSAMSCLVWLVVWSLVPLLVGWRSEVVLSGSMTPSVRAGDVVVIDPEPAKGYRVGQIVSFVDPGRPER